MERRKFTREFKLEAVRLIRDRASGMSKISRLGRAYVAASQLGEEVRRRSAARLPQQRTNQARAAGDRPTEARGDQAQGRAGHPKKSRGLLREGNQREVLLHCEAPGDLAGGMVVRGARCLARWLLCVAQTTTQPAQPNRRRARCESAGELHCQ